MSWAMSPPASMCFTIRATERCRVARGDIRLPCRSPHRSYFAKSRAAPPAAAAQIIGRRNKLGYGASGWEHFGRQGDRDHQIWRVCRPGGRRSGLVHISEIANTFVNDVHDFLQEGQTVKVLVLSAENGKINLSIKKALPREERPAPRPARPVGGAPRPAQSRPAQPRSFARAPQQPLPPSGDQSFEDKLKQFLSSSEGKMADLNRSIDGKRGGGRRRR